MGVVLALLVGLGAVVAVAGYTWGVNSRRPASAPPALRPQLPSNQSAPDSSTTAIAAPSARPFPTCSTPNMIADFEDGNPGVCVTGNRGGSWFLWFDGTGSLQPGPGILTHSEPLPEPRGASKYGVHFIGTGHTIYGPGLSGRLANGKTFDVSGYEGVALWIFSPRTITVEVKMATVQTLSSAFGGACEPTPQADCDDHHGARYSVGPHWKFVRAPFKSMKQLNHGVRAPFDPRQVLELVVSIAKMEDPPLSFDVWVDDMMFY